jgi:hypothetical protein
VLIGAIQLRLLVQFAGSKSYTLLSLLQSDGNTAFLRAARAGHLDKVLEHLKSNIDINTSNSVSTYVNTP